MDAQPNAETNGQYPSIITNSDDSDEEGTSQEETLAASWNDLSIIERVGLNSVEMSETDIESAFSQIALAFRCDQYTLKQRLQAEEHARNLAEENIQLELSRGRETLETLKGLCLDSKRSKILQRLELSLDILAGTVERISNTAEVLGAVHQEARVSRAVELMVAHVENLRRRHDRHESELGEARKMLLRQSSCRNIIDLGAPADLDESDNGRKGFQQNCSRRRVSISLLPSQTQEKSKRGLKKQASTGDSSRKKSFPSCPSPSLSSESSCSAMTKEDSYLVDDRQTDPAEPTPEAPAAPLTPPDLPAKPEQEAPRKIQHKIPPVETVRQRKQSKAASSKKKVEKDKKRTNIYRRISVGSHGSRWRQRPLVHWLYRCRWPLLCLYLLVLLTIITLIYFFWGAS